ncbi:ferritin-like domain-containing protein [Cellulomonas fimi]|uniref:Ferritin-like domain-containing protein n=1 Tax=Cellulomonas fimi TaxID=1708 RepID=A0A7Y0LWL4_CELFI|nr:ferritin-like domain-containing protein [Cellulomonas fimi]NMR19557.1 ferritin-like domain-containing protein [Cellulomonas fimi]
MALTMVGILAGCGLRLETPPPSPLTPDVLESARQRATADAVGLEVLAAAPAGDPAGDPADPVLSTRRTIAAHAREHVTQLGGTYRSGLEPTTSPSSAPTPVVTPGAVPAAATPEVLVDRLEEAAASARADASSVPDGPFARLLASVAAERLLAARALAAAAGIEGPALPQVVAPDAVPGGLAPSALSELVAAEDAAGYGYEVVAAKLSGAARAAAVDRALVHRTRAEQWAELAEIARTGFDPRRTVYAVPPGLEDPAAAAALARSMEQSLAATYASLVASADPELRSGLVDALAESSAAAVAWGAPVPAFPGLPERAAP